MGLAKKLNKRELEGCKDEVSARGMMEENDLLNGIGEEQLKELKKYNCMMCEAKFKGSGGLRNHYKVVHAAGPLYKCDDCGKEFPLKERLKLHVRTHTGFKPYKCTECGKSFARGGQLSQHRRTHSQIKPYHCNLCTGTFTCAANLALHMKRHNNQKDHTCTICGKGFIRRDALKKHLECLHKDLKTFLCVICNKTFKGHLPQHMRTHAHDRPHACSTCGQKFAQKSQLTVHQRTHTGQRPFRCLVCWQAFAHSTALKLHTRRHTGERPFKCTECNVGFTQLPHWKKHMKCIHKRTKPYSCKNCNNFFKKKNDLENHEKICHGPHIIEGKDKTESASETNVRTDPSKFTNMTLERMRLLLAVLLKRISKPERLDELGFGKRLIDEILQDSLISAGKDPIKLHSGQLSELQTLKKNLETFLEWTVPKEHWQTFKKMNKTPEEILETLTTT
uniref:ZNF470 protein n=1 Tax=Fopius arisanus TaxID=64838 RepID=A0A0C9REK8_9HYME